MRDVNHAPHLASRSNNARFYVEILGLAQKQIKDLFRLYFFSFIKDS